MSSIRRIVEFLFFVIVKLNLLIDLELVNISKEPPYINLLHIFWELICAFRKDTRKSFHMSANFDESILNTAHTYVELAANLGTMGATGNKLVGSKASISEKVCVAKALCRMRNLLEDESFGLVYPTSGIY